MAQGLTLQQLQSMGAKPASVTPQPSSGGGLTLAQLIQKDSTQNQPKQSFLDKATTVANSIFPGKQVGQAIGTAAGAIGTKIGDVIHGTNNSAQYDLSAPKPLQVAGDVAQGALSVAAPEIGNGGTALGRIGANAALGAGLGAANATAQGEKVGDVATSALKGGALGGGISAAGEGLNALSKNLPNWLTKAALPKLDSKNTQYALDNVKVGSIKSMAQRSSQSMGNYEDQIQTILNHPEFKNVAADSKGILDNAVSHFPNSDYTAEDLLGNAKSIAPKVSKLITKMEAGQANIQELNSVRKELDAATKSVYTTLNRPPESKMLGAALANGIRDYVQTTAPDTAGIFSNYSKEIGVNKALQTALKQGESKVKLKDLVAGSTGFAAGGFKGALEGIIAERLLTNPGIQLGAAKGLQSAAQGITPIVDTAFKAGKAPLIKGITNQK